MRYCDLLDELVFIDRDVREYGVFIAYSIAWFEKSPEKILDGIIETTIREVRDKYDLDKLRENPIVKAYRKFYWRIGIDPTKTRPSGEALVRRVLRGKKFPRINPIVDIGNLVSASTLISIGLYDVDKIVFPLKLVLSSGGELFNPIGGSARYLDQGIPILVDSTGRVIHVYPHRDSVDSSISIDTSKVLVIGAGVPGIGFSEVESAVSRVVSFFEEIDGRWCGSIVLRK